MSYRMGCPGDIPNPGATPGVTWCTLVTPDGSQHVVCEYVACKRGAANTEARCNAVANLRSTPLAGTTP